MGVYFGPPFYSYALNWQFVHLTTPWTRPLCMIKQNVFVYLYATTKSDIHIYTNDMKQVSYLRMQLPSISR